MINAAVPSLHAPFRNVFYKATVYGSPVLYARISHLQTCLFPGSLLTSQSLILSVPTHGFQHSQIMPSSTGTEETPTPIPLVDLKAEYKKHGATILSSITRVVESGAFILGPEVTSLEQKLAAYVQGPHSTPVHCIGVSDGTTALQLCLQALGVSMGDEVVTVPFTWISTAEVIPLVGAKPVFADIERDTYLMDVGAMQKALTERTRAVIVVSLFGLMPDLARMRAVLDEAEVRFGTKIALIEDGAQSFGARRGANVSCGALECVLSTTSFFPTKPLGCYGDGGAVFTRDERLAGVVRALRVHGKVGGVHTMVGVNGRLDTLQAAVLLNKIEVLEDLLEGRREVALRYNQMLGEDGRVVLPTYKSVVEADGGVQSAYGVYTIRVERRDEVVARLKQVGVGCAVYYKTCCHLQPVFVQMRPNVEALPVAEQMSREVLSLPIHPYLTKEAQTRVVRELRTALDDLGITHRPQ